MFLSVREESILHALRLWGLVGYDGAMSTTTFDTLKFAKRLESAGASAQLAEAIAEAQKDSMSEAMASGLVTRGDLAEAKAELKADVTAVRSEVELLRKDMQALSLHVIIRLSAVIAAATGLILAVLRFPH